MISAALLIYIGVQIGAPGWYYVLVGVSLLYTILKAFFDTVKGE